MDTCPKAAKDGALCYYCGETGHTTSRCIKAGIMGNSACPTRARHHSSHQASPSRRASCARSADTIRAICTQKVDAPTARPRLMAGTGGSCQLCGSVEHFRKNCPKQHGDMGLAARTDVPC